jgi:hypothetical protein
MILLTDPFMGTKTHLAHLLYWERRNSGKA